MKEFLIVIPLVVTMILYYVHRDAVIASIGVFYALVLGLYAFLHNEIEG